MGEGEGEKSSLPFSLPSFPFSPETPDTQATLYPSIFYAIRIHNGFYRFTDIGQSFHKVFSEKQIKIWSISWMTQIPQKGDFRELKSKIITRTACPRTPQELTPAALVQEIGQYLSQICSSRIIAFSAPRRSKRGINCLFKLQLVKVGINFCLFKLQLAEVGITFHSGRNKQGTLFIGGLFIFISQDHPTLFFAYREFNLLQQLPCVKRLKNG